MVAKLESVQTLLSAEVKEYPSFPSCIRRDLPYVLSFHATYPSGTSRGWWTQKSLVSGGGLCLLSCPDCEQILKGRGDMLIWDRIVVPSRFVYGSWMSTESVCLSPLLLRVAKSVVDTSVPWSHTRSMCRYFLYSTYDSKGMSCQIWPQNHGSVGVGPRGQKGDYEVY